LTVIPWRPQSSARLMVNWRMPELNENEAFCEEASEGARE